MKFSAERSIRRKESKEADRFLELLTSLNEAICSFEPSKNDVSYIYTDLYCGNLTQLQLPDGAYFVGSPKEDLYYYAFVKVFYNSKVYTICGKTPLTGDIKTSIAF